MFFCRVSCPYHYTNYMEVKAWAQACYQLYFGFENCKSCTADIQQIYNWKPMQQCDFNKVTR